MTDLAYGFWQKCEFLEIHLVGIGGVAGELFLDDVRIEETGPVLPSQVRKTGGK